MTARGMVFRELLRRAALCIVVASFTAPVTLRAQTAPAAARGFASADLHRLRSVDDVVLSPDGRTVAYVVQDRARPGRPRSQIWISEVAGGEPGDLVLKRANGPLFAT